MKKLIKDGSRLTIYLLYGLVYILFWKIAGFEITIIIMGAIVTGELDYQFRNQNK